MYLFYIVNFNEYLRVLSIISIGDIEIYYVVIELE